MEQPPIEPRAVSRDRHWRPRRDGAAPPAAAAARLAAARAFSMALDALPPGVELAFPAYVDELDGAVAVGGGATAGAGGAVIGAAAATGGVKAGGADTAGGAEAAA
ncbi:hypothetical protein GCM10020218_063860 [Dactylosporangium vinaceum]